MKKKKKISSKANMTFFVKFSAILITLVSVNAKISSKASMNFLLKFSAILITLVSVKAKILRVGRSVEARFTIIDTDYRVMANCVKNITNVKPNECADGCTLEAKCSTFNYHRTEGVCELLNISKFDGVGLLQRDNGWSHYETDDDASNVGPVCERLKPCQPFQVCEDTFKCDSKFVCKCKDGFRGDKCQHYDGPGSSIENPAPNCYSLLDRFRAIPDGRYWLKGRQTETTCGRRVDGRYTRWSQFTLCNRVCGGGTKTRHRNCTNPPPAFGGDDCSHLGPAEESKACAVEQCPQKHSPVYFQGMNRLNLQLNEVKLRRNNLLKTLDVFGKEFVVDFQFKPTGSPTGGYSNIIQFSVGDKKESYGSRVVLAAFTPSNTLAFRMSANLIPSINREDRSTRFPLNEWITVKIQQLKASNGSYVYSIYVNQVLTHSLVNTDARNFKNVMIYAACPWNKEAPGFIANFVVFQPDLCKSLCSATNTNCSSVVGSLNCTCHEDKGWFGNGTTCARKCLIEVMANDAKDEDDRGKYFHYDRRNILPIPIFINAKNSRSQKKGRIKTFDRPYNTKYDSHGRFDPFSDSSPGDWNVGDLVMIKDSKYCPTDVSWQVQQENVHFEAKDDQFGEFTLKKKGFLYSLKLEHLSGGISCNHNRRLSNWGCRPSSQSLYVVIIDENKKIVLPRVAVKNNFYVRNGFDSNSKSLSFHTVLNPLKVNVGDKLRIAHTEDLFNIGDTDNSGGVNVKVYAIII